jgi:hypothetical protein
VVGTAGSAGVARGTRRRCSCSPGSAPRRRLAERRWRRTRPPLSVLVLPCVQMWRPVPTTLECPVGRVSLRAGSKSPGTCSTPAAASAGVARSTVSPRASAPPRPGVRFTDDVPSSARATAVGRARSAPRGNGAPGAAKGTTLFRQSRPAHQRPCARGRSPSEAHLPDPGASLGR